MKKFLMIFIFLFFILFNIFPQDLTPISDDLELFLEGVGSEILPNMLQNELSGNGIWSADFNDDRKWFLSVSAGMNFSDGLFKFIEPTNSQFELLNVYNFVQYALDAAPSIFNENFNTFQDFFPYPNARIAGGFNFLWDTEMIFLCSFWPGGITKAIAEKAGIPGFELSSLNIGFRIRKILLKDQGFFPAISLGLGYTFANFHVAYNFPEFTQDWGYGNSLAIDGNLGMDTRLNAIGITLSVSKDIKFFVPFLGVSAWYQWAKFRGGINDYSAQLLDTGDNVIAEETDDLLGEVLIKELSIIFNGGFEFVLGRFVICPYSTFNFSTKNFTANLEMRLELGREKD